MAARPLALISEQEYLTAPYQPDCSLEKAVLIERNRGTEKHRVDRTLAEWSRGPGSAKISRVFTSRQIGGPDR